MKDVQSYGKMLKDLRERANLTQIDVARALEYSSAQFISNWERGMATPPLKVLKTLADLYHVKVEDLFEPILQMTLAHTENSLRKEMSRFSKRSARR